EELAEAVPRSVRWVLPGAQSETGIDEALWRAEAGWWRRVESDANALAVAPRPDPGALVGAAALLVVDAWRVRAALEVAARGGGRLAEVLDAVA
ncbi:MAG TPA: hypothetical protein VMH24_06380, partial [Candidatus Sulfotelmatobacter sp.]|nr:hypothetical protein [Candidatus Sulfotelmatobacter sp.]